MPSLSPSVVCVAASLLLFAQTNRPPSYVLECDKTFPAATTRESLAKAFGERSVVDTKIYVGEGFYEDGTVLFGDDETRRAEIFWEDAAAKQRLQSVCVREKATAWRTQEGIVIGTDLLTLEKLNRKPFRLAGFGWDGSGSQLSWSGGQLERPASSPCRLGVRLDPATDSRNESTYNQLRGDREFSSGHPAMQALNPRVVVMCLRFD